MTTKQKKYIFNSQQAVVSLYFKYIGGVDLNDDGVVNYRKM